MIGGAAPVPLTAGQGSRWSGAYGQARANYAFNANLTGAVEFVHYEVGDTIRQAGGHRSDYLGGELKFGETVGGRYPKLANRVCWATCRGCLS